jgi:hypothetical protein
MPTHLPVRLNMTTAMQRESTSDKKKLWLISSISLVVTRI